VVGTFLFSTAFRSALGPTQLPIQWMGFFPWGKSTGHEADHSPPSSAAVKECVGLYLHSPIRFHGVVLSMGTALPLRFTRDSAGDWRFVFHMKLRCYADSGGEVCPLQQVLTNFVDFIPGFSLVLLAVMILCVACGTPVRLHDAVQDGVFVTSRDNAR
jgi:hypothetical protein